MLGSVPARPGVWLGVGLLLSLAAGTAARLLTAADHRDSTVLTANPTQDIADVYSFRNPSDPTRFVLGMTVAGFIPPSEAATAQFGRDVLYQWKIDNDGDAVEDLVIQAFVTGNARNQVVHFRGPVAPAQPGGISEIVEGPEIGTVHISRGAEAEVSSRRGISVFAGVRDDPFFFDLARFNQIVSGAASSFNNPGTDTFAGFNILALVIELPAELLGGPTIGVWGTTSLLGN
jgi:Domain of unknown function (DUF4331)